MIHRLAKVALTAAMLLASHPVLAQKQAPAQEPPQPTVKELLGRAQTEADKRAVEDLVRKLKLQPGAAPGGLPDGGAAKTPSNSSLSTSTAPARTATTPTAPTPTAPTPTAPTPTAPTLTAPASAPPSEKTGTPRPGAIPLPTVSVAIPVPPSNAPAPPAPIAQAPEIASKMQLPTVDFEVFFNLDSAVITTQAVQQLSNLGPALRQCQVIACRPIRVCVASDDEFGAGQALVGQRVTEIAQLLHGLRGDYS